EDIVPANCDMSAIDKIIKVTDKDSALMTRKMARMEGIFIGWSCGAAVHGALEYARNLPKDALVVVILPDHGTRYLGKVYNDGWMQNHDFLTQDSILTAGEIIKLKSTQANVLLLNDQQPLMEAIHLMREQNVSQIPVTKDGEIIGSLNESRVLNTILDDPSLKDGPISQAMGDAFPFVLESTRMDVISKLINKDNPAVLVKKDDGELDIITEYDLIQVLSR
ncbi:MAG: pyridoxal-phosphate dependent enzyme, partial [Bacteroidota bacterium]